MPLFLHRWVWRFRRLDQLARLLSRKMPRLGDQLLGIIELAENRWEQARSRGAVPGGHRASGPRRRATRFPDGDAAIACTGCFCRRRLVLLGVIAVLTAFSPAATSNAWARLLRPWQDTPRYTFAALEPLPAELVVAHGEPFRFDVTLDSGFRMAAGARQCTTGRAAGRSSPSWPTGGTASSSRRRSTPIG